MATWLGTSLNGKVSANVEYWYDDESGSSGWDCYLFGRVGSGTSGCNLLASRGGLTYFSDYFGTTIRQTPSWNTILDGNRIELKIEGSLITVTNLTRGIQLDQWTSTLFSGAGNWGYEWGGSPTFTSLDIPVTATANALFMGAGL